MSALILVVDDEPDVAELFRQQFRKELRASRFGMAFALSAPEALERVGARGQREPHSHPLRRQHAGHERPRASASGA